MLFDMQGEAMRYLNNIANRFFGWLFSWLLDQPIRDTLCGTKAFSRENYARIKAQRVYFGDFDPFGDFDLLFGAAHLGLEIKEMPVRYRNRAYGNIKISRFRHGWLLLQMSFFAMRVWHWMYDNPKATPAQLREATVEIAKDVWNKYYAPVFGVKDSPILAIYSHMINSGLYLPDYPLGHIIAYQVEAYFEKHPLAENMKYIS